MNAFQIKVYLFPKNTIVSTSSIAQANEIRRFSLANNPNGLYKDLIEKIRTAYGSLFTDKDEIRTYWQDDENELVGFSTDNEMQYAIDLQTAIRVSKPYESKERVNGSVFKVYVQKKTPKPEKSEKSEYKSELNSENVDEEPLHIGVSCDGCEGPVRGIRYKCMTCPDYDLCSACQAKGLHKEHELLKISKPSLRPFFCGRKFGKHSGLFGKHGPYGKHGHGHSHSHRNSFHNLSDILPNLASNIPMVNNPEQLKNVGEFFKSFLDPFGIDVDYYVDNLTKKNTENDKKEEEKPKNENENEKEKEKEKDSMEEENVTIQEEKSKNDSEKSKEETNNVSSIILDGVEASTSKKHNDDNMFDIVMIPSVSTQASAPSLQDEIIEINPKAPFENAAKALKKVIIDNNKADENESKEKKAKENSNEENGFNLVDIEKELKIIRSIEQLRQMGYSDEGGWLTRLVSAKDGNINAVLDAISPFGIRN